MQQEVSMTLLRLGALLRERRGGRGIREVANEIGISAATLVRLEGGRIPDLATFQKVCSWLNVNPAEILDIPADTGNQAAPEPASLSAAVHLRADRTLPPTAATDLAHLILVAHQELARRREKRQTDVPPWF
jgi:transcriptional regulator with XRE-family HTH domain